MIKRVYRIISWGILGLALLALLLVLRKPNLPQAEASAEAAKSFDQKLQQLEEAHQQGTSRDIRITEAELNSKLQESLAGPPPRPPAGGEATLRAATVHLEGDRIQGAFVVNLAGKDFYLVIGGTLGVAGRSLVFRPTDAQLGSLPVPLAVVESKLRERLDSPDVRERMMLPESIKDIRIENGELVVQAQ